MGDWRKGLSIVYCRILGILDDTGAIISDADVVQMSSSNAVLNSLHNKTVSQDLL